VVVFGRGFAEFGRKTWFFGGENVVKCEVKRGGLQRLFVVGKK
jgi:hypothetical protein